MDLNKYFDLFKLLKFSKIITICSLTLALFSVCFALGYSYYLNNSIDRSYVYILDNKGEAYIASILNDELDYRTPEIHHHLVSFHNLFFNINQNNQKVNIDKALNLIGEEGKHYFITLDKKGWYKSIKLNNLQQSINITSIDINDKIYPYVATVKGITSVSRVGGNEDTIKKEYIANLTLINVSRTMENPHGLMIEQYEIVKHE